MAGMGNIILTMQLSMNGGGLASKQRIRGFEGYAVGSCAEINNSRRERVDDQQARSSNVVCKQPRSSGEVLDGKIGI